MQTRSATRKRKRKDDPADERDEDTQNQSREDVVAGRGDNLDAVIDAVVEKCSWKCRRSWTRRRIEYAELKSDPG